MRAQILFALFENMSQPGSPSSPKPPPAKRSRREREIRDLTIKDLKHVRNFLHSVAVKWYDIGIELEVDLGELQRIEHRYGGDTGACLREMLIIWLKSTNPRPSCTAVAKALRAKAVREFALAEEVSSLKHALDEGLQKDSVSGTQDLHKDSVSGTQDLHKDSVSGTQDLQKDSVFGAQDLHKDSVSGTQDLQKDSVSDTQDLQKDSVFGTHDEAATASEGKVTSIVQAEFPYLNTEKLSSEEKYQLIGKLESESKKMKREFITLVGETCKSLNNNNVKLDDVLVILKGFGIPGLSERETVSSTLSKIYESCTFFNYEIIATVINVLGNNNDKARLSSYEEKFKEYCKRRICEVPIDVLKSHLEAKTTLYVKTDKNFNVPANEIYSLGNELSQLLNTPLLLCDVKEGCVEFDFDCLKAECLLPLQESDHTETFEKLGITKVHTEHQVFYEQRNRDCGSDFNRPPKPKWSRQEKRRISQKMSKSRGRQLTVNSVVNYLKGLSWEVIGDLLLIPEEKLKSIVAEHSPDKTEEHLRAAVQYWFLRDPYASWARLAIQLDHIKEHELAESLRNLIGKQQDASLTVANICAVIKTVEVAQDTSSIMYGRLENCLELPMSKSVELRKKFPIDDSKYKEGLVKYWLKTSPYASWDCLARKFRYYMEDDALKNIIKYIKVRKDHSLTLENLTQVLEHVNRNDILLYLNIPSSEMSKIDSSSSSESGRKEATWRWYLKNNPLPSWRDIADTLYRSGQHEVLERLKRDYLKGSNESGQLFDEAMKLGHIDSQITKIILYGAAGVGKTSSMDLIIGNPPPQTRKSTPLAARPVAMFQIDTTNSKTWQKLPFKEKKRILAQVIHASEELHEEDSEMGGESSSEEDNFSDEEITEETGAEVTSTEAQSTKTSFTQDSQSRLHPVALNPPQISSEKKVSPKRSQAITTTCDDLVGMIEECAATDKPLNSFHKLHLIDSGGQPQFHEILPIFLRRMNLYIFVMKLSEELATKPMVKYYDSNGKPIGEPYQSALSNEQLLRHCLRTLHSHRSSKKRKGSSKIMIIGTHRDKEEKCQTETRDTKNKKLADILLPMFEGEVIYFKFKTQEFVFPINAKYPQPQDKKLAEDIQEIILANCCAEPIPVPLQYHGLEIVLEELSQVLGRGILSREECLEAALKLHFDEHKLDAALQFLDEISVVFYFPEILGNVIFTNSQVLLDKVTELVEAIHDSRPVHGGYWAKFKSHAIFTIEFLSQREFQKHYVEGLFTSVQLIKLFKQLFIVANFSNTEGSEEYFMPALLPLLKDKDLNKYRVPLECPVAALALDFPHGGPRLGIFCSLTCFLVSPENHFPVPWKIKAQRSSVIPVCLARNCIQFSIPDHPGTVTLIDTFTHFEIHFSIPPHAAKLCPKLCSFIIQAVSFGVRKASFTLGYNNSEPSVAILCPCGEGDPHTAKFGEGFWICSQDANTLEELESRHSMWLYRKPSEVSSREFTMKNIRAALKDLSPRKHLSLALELNLTKRSVEKHEMDWPRDSDRVLTEIIQDWLDDDISASWDTLKEALKEVQPALADTI